jgi:hypothetical protein
MNPTKATPSRAFMAAAAGVVLLVAGLSIHVASNEWFSRDDFAFLAMARHAGWSWLDVYLPLEDRGWIFYRPFGVQTFFRVAFELFGLNAFGFLSIVLATHFATGLWVWRLALQLGFAAPVALLTAVLSVSRYPSLAEIFYAAMFQYVALCFFAAAAVSLFLDYTRRHLVARQLGSCLALVLALLCNEAAVAIPAVLVLASALVDGRSVRALWQSARSAAPQIAITLGYLWLRFGILTQIEQRPLYHPSLGPHIARNLAYQIQQVFGTDLSLAISVGLLALVIAAVAANEAARAKTGVWLLRIGTLCLAWAALSVLPYTLLRIVQLRWSLPAEVPLCLLIGAAASALWHLAPSARRRALEFGLLGLVLASIPYDTLLARAADPNGAFPRHFASFVESQNLQKTARRLVVLYGRDGLATSEQATNANYLLFGGGVFRALYPGSKPSIRFHDLNRVPKYPVLVPRSVYAVLRADLSLALADDELVQRELGPWLKPAEQARRPEQPPSP